MQTSLPRSALSASLVAIASLLVTAPAAAMGQSTTPTSHAPNASIQTKDPQKNIVSLLQTQVEALRQKVAMLKVRVERQGLGQSE